MYRFSVAESANPNDYVGAGAAAGKDALLSQRIVAKSSPRYDALSVRAANEDAKNKVNAASLELIKRREERDIARSGLTDKALAARNQELTRAVENKRFAGKLALASELYEKGFGKERKTPEPYQPNYDRLEQLINQSLGNTDLYDDQETKILDRIQSNPAFNMTNPSSPNTGSDQSLSPVQGSQGDGTIQKVNYVPFQGNNRNRYALTQMIRHAEGTLAQGDLGFRTMFGGGLFEGFDKHPDTVVRTSRNASAAAGAYQFMPFTWKDVQKADPSITDFSPYNQEKGFDILARRRGVDPYADINSKEDLKRALHKLGHEWSSLPLYDGSAAYPNQSLKSHDELWDVFTKAKAEWLPPGVI
jgi:muramidase (phage lysozyme)